MSASIFRLSHLGLGSLLFTALASPALAGGPYEEPPTLAAEELLPADLLEGPIEGKPPEAVVEPERPSLAEDEVRARALEAGEDPERAVLKYRLRRDQQASQQTLAAESDTAKKKSEFEWMSEEVDKAARKYLGYDSARRDLARKLGIDPYSDNVRLQEELDKLAWAMWAGSFGLDRAIPTSSLINAVEDLDDVVWATKPKDLEVRNRKLMKGFGVDSSTRDSFYENRLYSITDRTQQVTHLAALEGVGNRQHFFRLAASAPGWELAAYYRRSAKVLAAVHLERPLERIVPDSEILVAAITRGGDLVLPLPVDHLAWTESTDLFLGSVERHRRAAAFEGKVVLLLAGDLTPRAREGIEGLGWTVRTWSLGRLTKSAIAP